MELLLGEVWCKAPDFQEPERSPWLRQLPQFPGMVAWFESSMKDSFLPAQAINNAAVNQWFNREPSGYLTRNNLGVFGSPATGTTAGTVTYVDRSINDLPAIRTDVAGRLSLTTFAGSPLVNSTVVVVFRPIGTLSATEKVVADSWIKHGI